MVLEWEASCLAFVAWLVLRVWSYAVLPVTPFLDELWAGWPFSRDVEHDPSALSYGRAWIEQILPLWM